MKKKNNKTALFVLLSYTKGVVHAIFIPYALLWIFQDLELKAFAVSALYISIVGLLYHKSKSHDLSGRAFFTALKVLAGAIMFLGLMVIVGTQQ